MRLKKTLCALLAVLLLVPMWTVPVTAAETGTVLYHQKAPVTFEEGKQVWPSNSSSGAAAKKLRKNAVSVELGRRSKKWEFWKSA